MSYVIIMLIAVRKETDLSIEHIAEFMGIQAYTLFDSSISVMRVLRVRLLID